MVPIIPSDEEQEAKRDVLEGRCVAFIGAGISIPPGRDWDGLVKEIADRCKIAFDGRTSLPSIIDQCIESDESTCNEACRELLPRHVATSRTAMNYLLKLPFRAILTTNFDPWLQQQSWSMRYKRYHIYPDLPIHNGLKDGLYYIHGFFDSINRDANIRSLVFGEQSFREAYEKSLLPGFLLNVFTYETILFIGINPTEKYLSRLLRASIDIRKKISTNFRQANTLPKRYILWPVSGEASLEESEIEKRTISETLSLDVTPIIYDKKMSDYRGLEEFLFNWTQEGDIKSRPPPFKTGWDL